MDKKDLFRAIGEIEDRYIEEAAGDGRSEGEKPPASAKQKKVIPIWRSKALVSAAAMLLCIGVGYLTLVQSLGGIASGAQFDTSSDYTQNLLPKQAENYAAGADAADAEEAENIAEVTDAAKAENSADAADTVKDGGNFKEEAANNAVSGATNGQGGQPKEPQAGEDGDSIEAAVSNDQKQNDYRNEVPDQGETEKLSAQEAEQLCRKPEGYDRELTLEEAWEWEDYHLGEKLAIPEAFQFCMASASEKGSLFLLFYRGETDYLTLLMQQADETVSDRDANAEDPLFDAAALTPELLKAIELDAQDGRPVLQFGILYPDLQVLEVKSCGLPAEEIYGLLILEQEP